GSRPRRDAFGLQAGLRRSRLTGKSLSLDGHLPALVLDGALAVMLDGLRGEHAALIILAFAIELGRELARGCHHYVEGLLGMTRAWQAEEETHCRRGEVVDVVQVEHPGLDRIGHGKQHFAVAGHAFVTMENIHLTETQTAFENVLQQRWPAETGRLPRNHENGRASC